MSKVEPGAASAMRRGIGTLPIPIASRTLRERRRCLVVLTLLAADLAVGTAAVSMAAIGTGAHARGPTGAVLVPASVLAYAFLGLYGGFGPSPYERLRLRAQGVLLLAGFAAVGVIIAGKYALLPFLALALLLMLVIGYYGESLARAFLIRHGLWGAPAAFVGYSEASRRLAGFLKQHPEFGINPVGSFPVSGQHGTLSSFRIDDFDQVASRIEVLVFGSAADAAARSLRQRLLPNARELVIVGEPSELQSLWVNTRTLGGVIGLELRRASPRKSDRTIKRLIDLALAIPACLLAAPLIGIAASAIRAIDGSPGFYSQDRVGMDGKRIRIWKLRTMYKDAEPRLEAHLAANPQARAQWQRYFKLRDDPRILPGIGAFLRRTSLDELPQLWTVVRGEMSLIGPRPFPPYHVSSFDPEFQAIRSMVPPGLSGLWQVGARSDGDLEVQRAQDLFYILNWSIWLDLYVLLETPLAVLGERGAR